MMSIQEVEARRTLLLERIAQQRGDLQTLTQSLARPLSFFDKGYAIAQKIRQQPKFTLAAALAAAFVLRKKLPSLKMGFALLKVARWWFSKNSSKGF
jgi:hypothetical protein